MGQHHTQMLKRNLRPRELPKISGRTESSCFINLRKVSEIQTGIFGQMKSILWHVNRHATNDWAFLVAKVFICRLFTDETRQCLFLGKMCIQFHNEFDLLVLQWPRFLIATENSGEKRKRFAIPSAKLKKWLVVIGGISTDELFLQVTKKP